MSRLANRFGDEVAAVSSWLQPYSYDPSRYPLSFLDLMNVEEPVDPRPVDRVVYAFWTGVNELTPARATSLELLRSRANVPVTLVTPDNLGGFVLPGHPLHAAYPLLSLNHRSDYLRGYFMHHFGGGYSDVKAPTHWWTGAFDRMEATPNTWVLGYPERTRKEAAWLEGALGRDIHRHHRRLVGNGAFIVRPGTPLTTEWRAEVDRRLDYYLPLLEASPGNTWGNNPGYPVPWTGLQSLVFQPLCLKYLDRVVTDPSLRPHLEGHR